MTIAVLFPGQGSQKVGMGLDLYQNTIIGKEIFNKVDKITGRELSKIFLYGTEEELNQTKNTQPSIVTISAALTLLLKEELKNKNISFNPVACCGHSLGEFTALWFMNFLQFDELIKLVSMRGALMQNAKAGAMAAILNLSQEKIEDILNESEFKNKIVIANYNSPQQYVVSGNKESFNNAIQKIKSIGGKAIILPVSGAFHSHLMEDASKMFSTEIDNLQENQNINLTIPIYQNHDGKPSKNFRTIKEKIKKQMTSPVLWTQTINNLANDGVTAVVEIGSGKVLTGLVKKINPNIVCYNISDIDSLTLFSNSFVGV